MTHSTGPLLARALEDWLPCSLLRKLQSHLKASPGPGRGLWKFLMPGRSQLLQREGLLVSLSSHWEPQKGESPVPKQEPQQAARQGFSPHTAFSKSSQLLGSNRPEKDLEPTRGTDPQRAKFSHPETRKDLSERHSGPPRGWRCLASPESPASGRGKPFWPRQARRGVPPWAAHTAQPLSATKRLSCEQTISPLLQPPPKGLNQVARCG